MTFKEKFFSKSQILVSIVSGISSYVCRLRIFLLVLNLLCTPKLFLFFFNFFCGVTLLFVTQRKRIGLLLDSLFCKTTNWNLSSAITIQHIYETQYVTRNGNEVIIITTMEYFSIIFLFLSWESALFYQMKIPKELFFDKCSFNVDLTRIYVKFKRISTL